jgi:predicted AlkP superfamily phosphohydrolase/phosphomutase
MLLILGLDGATLDLAAPWVADGTLPHLAALMQRGAWGRLASTVPPATLPSWTTFMTGVNPGQHGVFDFTRRVPGTYRVEFVNATLRRAPSVWRVLSDAGRRVCVLGVPGTFPPEPLNGCMLSGFDTPVTTRADRRFAYPPALADDVQRFGGFPFADFQEFHTGPGWHADALGRLLHAIERKAALAEWLLERESWDCFMLLMGESDTVAHHFWAFHDPASPRFNRAGAAALGDPVRRVYAALDALLGRLVERRPDARVLVVSDHGFGGTGDTALFLNRWLAEQGFLAWRPRRQIAGLARAARQLAVRMIPEQWQARCFRLAGGRVANALETGVRFGGIDWRGTRAFSEELNYFPAIWLNVAGRDPQGRVTPGDYDRTCADLTERLLAWRDPRRDQAVVRTVWRRDDIYCGPCTPEAPDLILDLHTPGGYSYVCLPSDGLPGPPLERLDGAALTGGKLRGMSGSHRPDGLFVLAGDGIVAGEVAGAWIGDLAPTMLALCGVRPHRSDGRVLSCVAASPVEEPDGRPCGEGAELPYRADEQQRLRETLQRLGYLE